MNTKTKGDAKQYFLRALDEATKKGVEIAPSKNADYRDKFDYFLDSSQKYVAGIIRIPESFQITQSNIDGMTGSSFDTVQVFPDDQKTYTITGCKSLYFEMDNVGTCTIKVNGIDLEVINNTAKRQYTVYKRLTGASDSDVVTLEFTGLYPYNIRNIGFYKYPFPTQDDIPEYRDCITYDMPDNFLEFNMVTLQSDPNLYEAYVAYRWDSRRKIILPRNQVGSFDIEYYKQPADVPVDASEDTLLEIDDKALAVLALHCGVLATAADNPALSGWLRTLESERLVNISDQIVPTYSSVQTVFSIM